MQWRRCITQMIWPCDGTDILKYRIISSTKAAISIIYLSSSDRTEIAFPPMCYQFESWTNVITVITVGPRGYTTMDVRMDAIVFLNLVNIQHNGLSSNICFTNCSYATREFSTRFMGSFGLLLSFRLRVARESVGGPSLDPDALLLARNQILTRTFSPTICILNKVDLSPIIFLASQSDTNI